MFKSRMWPVLATVFLVLGAGSSAIADPRWEILDANDVEIGVPFFHQKKASLGRGGHAAVFNIGGFEVILNFRASGAPLADAVDRRPVRGVLYHPHSNDVSAAEVAYGAPGCQEPMLFHAAETVLYGNAFYGYVNQDTGNIWIVDLDRLDEVITVVVDTLVDGHNRGTIRPRFSDTPRPCLQVPAVENLQLVPGINLGPFPFPHPLRAVLE